MPQRKVREQRGEKILVRPLYKEHFHIQDFSLLLGPLHWPSLPYRPTSIHFHETMNKNVFGVVAVILKYHFATLSGLMSKYFDVGYLNLRTMVQDERLKKPSCSISLFVKNNNLMSYVMI